MPKLILYANGNMYQIQEPTLCRFFLNVATLEALASGKKLPEDDALPGEEDYCAGLPLSDLQAKACGNALFARAALAALVRCVELHVEGQGFQVVGRSDFGKESGY